MAKNEQLREGDDLTKAGVKFDKGKTRYDLLPPEGVDAVAVILTLGAEKYAARNWEGGMDWSRPFGAALRHLFAWWSGESRDPDTNRSHLWHAATNIFFLITYEIRGVGKDDRPVQPKRADGSFEEKLYAYATDKVSINNGRAPTPVATGMV